MFFSILFEYGKTIAIAFLLNDYFIRNHNAKHNEIMFDVAFNIIYVYSYCQIHINNGVSYITKKIPLLKTLFENIKKTSTIDAVKDGCIIKYNMTSSEPLEYISDYDFLIFIDNHTKPSNIKIIRDEKNYDYNKSDIKFILVEFCVSDKKYVIDLSNDKFNFYIENNIFDKNFFIYYLRYFHPDKIETDETTLQMDEITLKIIDQNVDIKTIDFTKDLKQYIRLNKNSYEIIRES